MMIPLSLCHNYNSSHLSVGIPCFFTQVEILLILVILGNIFWNSGCCLNILYIWPPLTLLWQGKGRHHFATARSQWKSRFPGQPPLTPKLGISFIGWADVAPHLDFTDTTLAGSGKNASLLYVCPSSPQTSWCHGEDGLVIVGHWSMSWLITRPPLTPSLWERGEMPYYWWLRVEVPTPLLSKVALREWEVEYLWSPLTLMEFE